MDLEVEEARWSVVSGMLTEYPELRGRALLLILGLRDELGADARNIVIEAFKPVHEVVAKALQEVGDAGLIGEALFSSERGYLLVQLTPAQEREVAI